MSHVIIEGGVQYRVTIVAGKTVYDPPLPKQIVKRNAKRLKAMLDAQSPPRSMTDVELFADVGTLDKQYRGEEQYLDSIVAGARKHGFNPNPHDFYMGNMARFVGDPEAFVPPTGGRGHIRKVCEQRGIPSSGAVNLAGREPEVDPWEAIEATQKRAKEVGRSRKASTGKGKQ